MRPTQVRRTSRLTWSRDARCSTWTPRNGARSASGAPGAEIPPSSWTFPSLPRRLIDLAPYTVRAMGVTHPTVSPDVHASHPATMLSCTHFFDTPALDTTSLVSLDPPQLCLEGLMGGSMHPRGPRERRAAHGTHSGSGHGRGPGRTPLRDQGRR